MEYTIAALVVVLLLTIFVAWLVMVASCQPDPRDRRDDDGQGDNGGEAGPPEGEHRIEIESEKLANRPR